MSGGGDGRIRSVATYRWRETGILGANLLAQGLELVLSLACSEEHVDKDAGNTFAAHGDKDEGHLSTKKYPDNAPHSQAWIHLPFRLSLIGDEQNCDYRRGRGGRSLLRYCE